MKKNIYRETGLSLNNMNIIALIFILLNSIYLIFTAINVNVVIYLSWFYEAGIILFIYTTVVVYNELKDWKKLTKILYILYLSTTFINFIITKKFPISPNIHIRNSLFGTLFLLIMYLYFVDKLIVGINSRSFKDVFSGIICMILPVIVNLFINPMLSIIVPLPFFVEGGIGFIIIGILFHLFKENKNIQILVSVIISLPYFNCINYKYMNILSSICIYFFNDKKDKTINFIPYIIYLVHIYIIYILAWFIQNYNLIKTL